MTKRLRIYSKMAFGQAGKAKLQHGRNWVAFGKAFQRPLVLNDRKGVKLATDTQALKITSPLSSFHISEIKWKMYKFLDFQAAAIYVLIPLFLGRGNIF